MKYFESCTLFHYTWEQVAQGFWRRYPNPWSHHVISEDTVSREVKDGKLYSKRLLIKTSGVPKWGERFVKTRFVRIIEESVLDPKEKSLVTYSRNISLTNIMSVVEKVTYKVSDENSNWTVAQRSAWFDSSVPEFFKSIIIAFGFEKFRINCQKAAKGFEDVLSGMFPNSNPTLKNEKLNGLKPLAKTASGLAKSKTNSIFVSCQPTEE